MQTALAAQDYEYPIVGDETDWLTVAQRIASLYQPPHTGRPSNCLTDVYRVHKLLTLIARGNYPEVAVRSAGFSKQTYYNWREQAKGGNIAAIALLDALEKAEADGEAEAVEDVRKAGKSPQFWAASMTRLQRRHRERWDVKSEDSAPRVVVQVGGSGQVQVNIGLSPATVNDLAQISTGQV